MGVGGRKHFRQGKSLGEGSEGGLGIIRKPRGSHVTEAAAAAKEAWKRCSTIFLDGIMVEIKILEQESANYALQAQSILSVFIVLLEQSHAYSFYILSTAAFVLQAVAATERRPKIFTTWLFTKQVCWLLY